MDKLEKSLGLSEEEKCAHAERTIDSLRAEARSRLEETLGEAPTEDQLLEEVGRIIDKKNQDTSDEMRIFEK